MKTKQSKYESSWGGTPWQITGTRTFARWHENPAKVFRLVGKAHEILKLRHTGWFLDQDVQDETTHGVVYRLTHSKGFLAAGSDGVSGNDDAAYFEVREDGQPYVYDTAEEAARNADRLAELYAEAESEYQRQQREEMQREDNEREERNLTEAFSFAA